MNEPMSDDELLSLLERERNAARDFTMGQIGQERRMAYEYYYGKPFGNEETGRSQIVSQLVAEVVDTALPDVIKVFAGSEDAVECVPRNAEDVEAAQQATDICNYVFWTQNNGFLLLYEGVKDAFLQKTGVWKYYWDTEVKVSTESYQGLVIDQLTMLMQDPQIEVVAQTAYPDPSAPPMVPAAQAMQGGMVPGQPQQPGPSAPAMLYDVQIRRKKTSGKVCITCIAPEEVLISPRARSIDPQSAPYIGIRTRKTLSDLIDMGYDPEVVMDLHSDAQTLDWNEERTARVQRTGSVEFLDGDDTDGKNPSMREVWYNEEYILVDRDGDGIAERRSVCSVGSTLLHDEVIERVPLAIITPKIMPHEFFGISLADDCMDLQLLKSTLWRQSLDNIYISNNPRTIILDGQANIDDILTPTPGGVIRETTPGSIRPYEVPFTAAQSFQMIEFLEQETQGRTGIDRMAQSPALNPDVMQQTVGGANIALTKAQSRLELICRTFAETGIRQLFQGILWLLSKHQDKAMVARIRNKFVAVDPRAWNTEYDFVINVGLGTGSKDQQMAHMTMFGGVLEKLAAQGLVTPKNGYNFGAEYGKILGFKDVDKFITDPLAPPDPANPKPPPQPNPLIQAEQIKAQAAQQIAQVKQQADAQVAAAKAQADQVSEQARAQADIAIKQHQATMNAQLELEKAKLQMQLDDMRHSREQDTQIRIANIKAASAVEVARISKLIDNGAAVLQQEMAGANGT